VPSELLKQGLLYPLQSNIWRPRFRPLRALQSGLRFRTCSCRAPRDMVAFIREQVYKPEYRNEAVRAGVAA